MGFIFRPFMMLATGNFRGLFSLLLSLALVGGLWELTLVNLSSQQTAVSLMTDIGVEFINPVLTANSLGVAQGAYTNLEKAAAAHPTQPLNIPGIKVRVLGSEIAGKTNFNDGTRVIYADVAKAYYDGGSGAVFAVPAQVGQVIGALGLLPQAIASQAGQQVGAPSLPSVPLPPLAGLGLSLALLTAQGHAQAVMLAEYFWAAAGILMLLVALLSHRWARLSTPAWALFSSALPGLIGIGIIWYFWSHDTAAFTPYASILHDIGGAFIPVYAGAAALGLAAVIFAAIARPIFKHRGKQKPHEPEHGQPHVRTDVSTAREWADAPDTGASRAPRPGGNGSAGSGGSGYGGASSGASGYGASGYGAPGYGGSEYGASGYGGAGSGGGFGPPRYGGSGGGYSPPDPYGQGAADPFAGSARPPFAGSAGHSSGPPSGPFVQRPPAWGQGDAGERAWPPSGSSGQRPPAPGGYDQDPYGSGGFGQGSGFGQGGSGNQPPEWPVSQDDGDAWPPRR